jgi:hypothetical protein
MPDRRRGARHVRPAALESLADKRTLQIRDLRMLGADLRVLARFS